MAEKVNATETGAITIGIVVAYFSNVLLQYVSQHALGGLDPTGWWHWLLVAEVWRGMFGAEAIPAIAFMLLLLGVPETPRWLAKQGADAQARAVLARIVGPEEADREMKEIRDATSHLRYLKIAVMGCIVNGPGEMADAHYGYVGAGPGLVTLYKGGDPVHKNLPEQEALQALINLMKEEGDWIDPET